MFLKTFLKRGERIFLHGTSNRLGASMLVPEIRCDMLFLRFQGKMFFDYIKIWFHQFDNCIILKIFQTHMSNLQTFKFIFTAEIGVLNIKANVSSPTYVTWKRSQQSATSQVIDMTNGHCNFGNEALKLPVNMYFQRNNQCFQEKKSSFSFTMKTPKGQKTAGVAYIDLSKMLNNKLEETNEEYTLEKCPVNGSTVKIRVTAECLGEKSGDSVSQASQSMIGAPSQIQKEPSTLSINSVDKSLQQLKVQQPQNSKPSSKVLKQEQNQEVQKLKKIVQQLTKDKQNLLRELNTTKAALKSDNTKEELIKAKSHQDKLQNEVNSLKEEKVQHEKQLEKLRQNLQQVYSNLHNSLQHIF